MAHQVAGRALWNKKNKQEQGLLISHPRYSDVLNNKRPSLVSTVQPASLWPHLRKYNVVGESLQDKMTMNSTRAETVEKLLDHVERGPTWQLHSFLRACNLTDQSHIIIEVGLNPDVYDGPSPPESDSEEDVHPAVEARADVCSSDKMSKCSTQSRAGIASGQDSIPPLALKPQVNLSTSQYEGHEVRRQTSAQILGEALTVHSEYYRDNLMVGRVFDFKHHEAGADFYNIDPCYIQQDLDVQKSKRLAEQIKMRDVLQEFGKYSLPRTVLLVGPAGAGKSTFFRRFAFCWSKELLRHLQDPSVHPLPELSAVIYIPARSLTTDIWGSIEHAICCKESGRRLLINQIQNEQLIVSLYSPKPRQPDGSGNTCTTDEPFQHTPNPKSAFLIDGIDEIRDAKVLKALEDFVREIHQEGGPQILVSARTGLSRMDDSIFNRFLHLEGYTLEQGLDYVQKYITQFSQAQVKRNKDCDNTDSTQDQQEHPLLSQLKKQPERWAHILSNPLRAHVLSGLTVEGLIELDDDNVLQSVDLLKTMENFFIKRETGGKGVPEEERNQFYRLCLYGLLEDIRQFTEHHLQQFDVSTSAYVSFLRKDTRRDKYANQVTYFSFDHELLYEFFAARAIETVPEALRYAILLYISSRDILRNLQKLIFGVLGEFGTEQSVPLLIHMTQLIMLKEALNKSEKHPKEQALQSLTESQNASESIDMLNSKSDDLGNETCLSALFHLLQSTCCHGHSPSAQSPCQPLKDYQDTPRITDAASGSDPKEPDPAEIDAERWQEFLPRLLHLFQSIEDGIPALGDLLCTKDPQSTRDIKMVAPIWDMIDMVFSELTAYVKAEKLHERRYLYFQLPWLRERFLELVVLDLLAELTTKQQEAISKATYLKMLPCNGFYRCGNMRWAEVRSHSVGEDIRFYCWSPEDLLETLLQHGDTVKNRASTHSLAINLVSVPSQWGHAPAEHWTRAAWDRALQAVLKMYCISGKPDFYLPPYAPVSSLLQSIARLEDYSYSEIAIAGGHVHLEDLYNWHQYGNTKKIKLKLLETKIHPPTDKEVRQELCPWVGRLSSFIDYDPDDLSGWYYVSEYLIIDYTK